YLYWCKKKMNLADMEAFINGGEAAVAATIKNVDAKKVEASEAEKWLARAETFAKRKPAEHLLIAIRFFEVADRFKGGDVSLRAQERSLNEMTLAQQNPATPQSPKPAKPVSPHTLDDFEGGGTASVLTQSEQPPGPAVVRNGPSGSFLRLTWANKAARNYIA